MVFFKRLSMFVLICGIVSAAQIMGQVDDGLWEAIKEDNCDQVRMLLEAECDIDQVNKDGFTPLEKAVWNENEEMVRLFVEAGANVNGVNNDNKTPLHCAILKKNKGIATFLLEAGADVNTKSMDGHFPLYYAVMLKNRDIARLFVKYGADLSVKHNEELTLLFYSAFNGDEGMVRLLLQRGAKVDGSIARLNNSQKRMLVKVVSTIVPKRAAAIRNFLNISADNSSSINRGQGFSTDLEKLLEGIVGELIAEKSVQQNMEALPIVNVPVEISVNASCLVM